MKMKVVFNKELKRLFGRSFHHGRKNQKFVGSYIGIMSNTIGAVLKSQERGGLVFGNR